MKAVHGQTRQMGFSLIELMVGIVIGLVTMLAIYQVYSGVEQTKRNVISTGDMQTNGLYALFTVQEAVGNAGAGLTSYENALRSCPGSNYIDRFRPLPVVAFRGPGDDSDIWVSDADASSDQLFVFYAAPAVLAAPTIFQAGATLTDASVLAPLGQAFVAGDNIVLTDTSLCASAKVTNVAAVDDPAAGYRKISFSNLDPAVIFPAGGRMVNLGQDGKITRELYWLGSDGVFRRKNLLTNEVTPIIANVMRFQVQYGIGPAVTAAGMSQAITDWVNPGDTTADGFVWAANALRNDTNFANSAQRIKAIRVGFVLRSDDPDKSLAGTGFNGYLFGDAVGGDCTGVAAGRCPAASAVTVPAASGAFDWRYRKYETTIPLLNNIWF